MTKINLRKICGRRPTLALIPEYKAKAIALAGDSETVVLRGMCPMWAYLEIARALRRKGIRITSLE